VNGLQHQVPKFSFKALMLLEFSAFLRLNFRHNHWHGTCKASCAMRALMLFFLIFLAYITSVPSAFAASAVDNAPLEQRHTITLTNTVVWQYEVALCPGLAYTFEPVSWARLGIDVGGFALGSIGASRQQLFGAIRVLDSGAKPTHFRFRTFAAFGIARFTVDDHEDDGPGPSSRATFGTTATLALDATFFGGTGSGFTARLDVGYLLVLDQSLHQATTTYEATSYRNYYSAAPLTSVAFGYSF
jgi:hypothetical protein